MRAAGPDDVPDLVRLINVAFAIERFFKTGDRTTVEEIRDLARRGEFPPARRSAGQCVGLRLLDARGRRAAGCPRIKIHIVNLRQELPPFYRRLGYAESGTLPFPSPEEATLPCHFIVMTKALG